MAVSTRVTGRMVSAMGWVWSPGAGGCTVVSGPRGSRGGTGSASPPPPRLNTRAPGLMDCKMGMGLRHMQMEVTDSICLTFISEISFNHQFIKKQFLIILKRGKIEEILYKRPGNIMNEKTK